MQVLREWGRRVGALLHGTQQQEELAEEFRFHVDTRADELEAMGLPRREALLRARREFGPGLRLQEESREAWSFTWLEDLLSDLRLAVRTFRRQPSFVAAAVFSLALGIGANTTIFSLTMEFLFGKTSCWQPETLLNLRVNGNSHASMREYRFLKDTQALPQVAGYNGETDVNLRLEGETRAMTVMKVSANFFEVTGTPVREGRGFTAAERNAVVLNHGFWQQQLGGQPGVIGRTLVLDGQPFTVVGILPRDHRTLMGFGFQPALYMPAPEAEVLAILARVPEGMRREEVQARLQAALQEMDRVLPPPDAKQGSFVDVRGVDGWDRLAMLGMGTLGAFFGLLGVVVVLVLVIACANVASLMLARMASRQHELAVRVAIGARRGRLVRQLLAESLMLSVLGTAAGLLLNLALTQWISSIPLPLPVPIQIRIEPDVRLLCYASALALVTALLCGWLPAWSATRAGVNQVLKQDEHQTGARRWELRNLLVIGQLSLSIVLLATALLFLRNLLLAANMSPGFDLDQTVWAVVRLVPDQYPARGGKVRAFYQAVQETAATTTGVESASLMRSVPLNSSARMSINVRADGATAPRHVLFHVNRVSPDYFRTIGIRLLAGRDFTSADRQGTAPVIILNRQFAHDMFGAHEAVGRVLYLWDGRPYEVVGVAENSKYATLGEKEALALYEPLWQQAGLFSQFHVIVRTQQPQAMAGVLRERLGRLDPTAAVEVKPMRRAMGFALLPSRAGAALLGSMGMLALALAALGLYGVLAYAVARRWKEIGLRMALGAGPASVLRLVYGDGLRLVVLGGALGAGLTLLVTQPLALFLVPGLSPRDPWALLGVAALLLLVALLAIGAPARRALRVDPMIALRWE